MNGSETTGARLSADDVGRPAPPVYRFLNRVMRRLDSRLAVTNNLIWRSVLVAGEVCGLSARHRLTRYRSCASAFAGLASG